ncbi:hypothetical protein [Leekyejoonella antrihumi]|uniref:Uncharacterized protein n=1 Tax=Leekyejoonella antrihumi TaxID=1660198 RepID=A0A563DVW6_9MICO|nr:hypothetical protein [Leekyejoonella antrihumi]TWP34335.1 hypothetical protein FGL98_18055 [Leekyejoonella antrihumi]
MPSWCSLDLAEKLVEGGVLRHFGCQSLGRVLAEHGLEGWREVDSDNFLVEDVEPLEDGLVQVAPLVVVGCQVGRMGSCQQRTAVGQFGVQRLFGQAGATEHPLGVGLLGCNAQLLTLEMFDVDGVGVVGLQQLV